MVWLEYLRKQVVFLIKSFPGSGFILKVDDFNWGTENKLLHYPLSLILKLSEMVKK